VPWFLAGIFTFFIFPLGGTTNFLGRRAFLKVSKKYLLFRTLQKSKQIRKTTKTLMLRKWLQLAV
jgi:hypothetical protein